MVAVENEPDNHYSQNYEGPTSQDDHFQSLSAISGFGGVGSKRTYGYSKLEH